jgi:hypothetical protein
MNRKTITFTLLDPHFEDALSRTALGLIEVALTRDFDVNVFSHEGALEPKQEIGALFDQARARGAKLDWVTCRDSTVPGVRRGTAADLWVFVRSSDHTVNIVETSHRADVGDDDPDQWLVRVLRASGVEADLLLSNSSVNYALVRPPELERDLAGLLAEGVKVWLVEEDVKSRGIEPNDLVQTAHLISRAALPQLLEGLPERR